MPTPRPDPAPRRYSPFVTLLRRAEGGPTTAPERTTLEAIEAWLLGDALGQEDLLLLFESLVWRLLAAGLPLERASLHVGTLHPLVYGFAWNWNRADGLCDECKVPEVALNTDSYRRSPLYRVIEHGEAVHGRTDDRAVTERFPLLAELGGQGIVEYLAQPLNAGGPYHNAATVATGRAEGFTPAELDGIQRILRILALHVERHIAHRIAANICDTYLGEAAGGRVLRGQIKRGQGEAIRAVIWASDLRGFTDLVDRLEGPATIALLNAYFERLAEAVIAHEGEVLKFIGDGLLAVFPFSAFESEAAAAEASLAAARQALAEVEALSDSPPEELAAIDGWRPLRTAIALHDGEAFFGNVGASERLDFTVIGRAVNAASRVEALSKTLGRSLLITETVARRLSVPLDDLGRHALRGLAEPVGIFSPRA